MKRNILLLGAVTIIAFSCTNKQTSTTGTNSGGNSEAGYNQTEDSVPKGGSESNLPNEYGEPNKTGNSGGILQDTTRSRSGSNYGSGTDSGTNTGYGPSSSETSDTDTVSSGENKEHYTEDEIKSEEEETGASQTDKQN